MTTATDAVTTWLADFSGPIESGDHDKAADLFGEESYLRDLVTFTWNIKTVEGRDQIRDMLEAEPVLGIIRATTLQGYDQRSHYAQNATSDDEVEADRRSGAG